MLKTRAVLERKGGGYLRREVLECARLEMRDICIRSKKMIK